MRCCTREVLPSDCPRTAKQSSNSCKNCLSSFTSPLERSLEDHFNNFMKFLNTRRQLLQNLDSATTSTSKLNNSDKTPYRKAIKPISAPRGAFHSHVGNNLCRLCNGKHRITDCLQFTSLAIPERKNVIIKNKLCLNCLRPGHESSQCPVSYTHLDVYKRQIYKSNKQ